MINIDSPSPVRAVVQLAAIAGRPKPCGAGIVGFRIHIKSRNVNQRAARDPIEINRYGCPLDGARVSIPGRSFPVWRGSGQIGPVGVLVRLV